MAPTWGCTAAASILSASSAMQAHAASRLSVLLERACLPQNATTCMSPRWTPSVLHPVRPLQAPPGSNAPAVAQSGGFNSAVPR